MNKLVVIVGPTASGKSALAMELAQKYNGEIICADSRTIYRGFDIGTAKPSREDQALVPHHLLDICEPGEEFSVAQFKALAEATLQDIWARGKVVFLVGGSGLYIDALLFGYQFRSSKVAGEEDAQELTLTQLQAKVQAAYPADYATIDHHNRLRLEQILQRGLADNADRSELTYDCLMLGLETDRLTLKQKIADRIKAMLSNGFVQEAEGLMQRYGHDCPQLSIIGYHHARDYLDGQIGMEALKERFTHDDAALAKRQMTWFRRNHDIHWLTESGTAGQLVRNYLAN